MKRIERSFIFTTTLLMGLVLSRFAISKLTGWEISVQAFIEMAKPLGIDPTFFRVSTGIVILIVFISYLITAILVITKNGLPVLKMFEYYNFAFMANLLGLFTMLGALLAEFFLREQPKWLLVYIAIGIVVLSTINLFILKNKSSVYSRLIKLNINV